MDKEGKGHVEIILAFILFIAAVGFALYFFNPGNTPKLADTYLDYLFREISQNVSVEVETFSVILNSAALTAGGKTAVAVDFADVGGNAVAETDESILLETSRIGEIVYIQKPQNLGWQELGLIYVTFSEYFPAGTFSQEELNEEYYEIGSSQKKNAALEKKFEELSDSYVSNYEFLKGREMFNIPDTVNFGFSLEFGDGTKIEATREIPSGLEIYSKTEKIKILKTEGEIVFADLTLKVW